LIYYKILYVHSFNHDGDSCRLHSLCDRYRDLLRESLLHLESSTKNLHDSADRKFFFQKNS